MAETGDRVFPYGRPPRTCALCGQYEQGRGWRMGFAKSSHGRKHVKEGFAREVINGERYDFILTADGAKRANDLADGELGDRCASCGLVEPHHTRQCYVGYAQRRFRERRTA